MNTSVRVLGIALAVLMLAARGLADEVEDRASSRTPSQEDHVAQVLVIVPENAEVWFEGEKTRQTGSHRQFWSPVLTPGKTYYYEVKVRWLENGKPLPVMQTQTIEVSANRISRVDFTQPEREPLAPHRGFLTAAAFSPDGKLLATAGGEQRIILWDPATHRRLGEFQGREPLAFSPDGKLLAGGGPDKSVRVWDVSSREEVRRLPAAGHASCLAFAPGGRELAVLPAFSGIRHSRLVLWDVKTGREVFTSEEVPPDSGTVVFSPDGRFLAVGGGQPSEDKNDEPEPKWKVRPPQPSIVILDAASGQIRKKLKGEHYTHQLRYTPDGKTLVASGHPQPITLWDPANGRLLGKFGALQRGGGPLALTSDGRTLVYEEPLDSMCVRRLDGRIVRRWHVPVRRPSIRVLALCPDDRTLLTGSLQGRGFRLWDITTGKERLPTERPPAKRP